MSYEAFLQNLENTRSRSEVIDARLAERAARKEAAEVTRLLCDLCKASDRWAVPLPSHVAHWWKNHKKIDRRKA